MIQRHDIGRNRPTMPKVPSTGDIELRFAARQAGCRALWFYPTIGAAIAAGLPWLCFSCPECGQFGSVDLRKLDPVDFVPPAFARFEMLTAERA